MSTLKPTLTAYSPGDVTGYVVTAGNYNTEVLQQGAWTQLMLGAATSFPASPASGDTCFRSDLGAWFRYDGTAWQQMGARLKIVDNAYAVDQYSASPYAGSTQTNLGTSVSFTVLDLKSNIEVIIALAAVATITGGGGQIATSILIDGTTRYTIGQTYVPTAGTIVALFGGIVNIGSLSAGTHTVQVQFIGTAAGSVWLLASTAPTYYQLRTQVMENKA
jgi:hypothetical protein